MSGREEEHKPGKGKLVAAIAGGVALLVLAAVGLGAANAAKGASGSSDVVTEAVRVDDITQTVSGTGSLAADADVNVLVPADLVVEQVLVKKGDVVEVGTPIAKVSAASVRAKLLAIEENIDSLQSELDHLSASAEHYELKKSVLNDQIGDLVRDRDAMVALQETLTLTSDTAGIVGQVQLFAGTATGQTSLREQKAASQDAVSGQQDVANDGSATSLGSATEEAGAQEAAFDSGSAAVATTADYAHADASRGEARESFGVQLAATYAQVASDADVAESDALEAAQEDGESAPGSDGSQQGASGEGEGVEGGGGDEPATPEPAGPTELRGRIELSVTPPATGAAPQDEPGIADGVTQFGGTIEWVPGHDAFAPQTEYQATIYLTAEEGYCFASDAGKLDVTVTGSSSREVELLDLDGDGVFETVKVVATFPATGPAPEQPQGEAAASEEDFGGSGGDYSFGGTDVGSDGSSLTKSGASYSDTEAVALTVTPTGSVYLDIQVDELDVLQLEVGQEAQVTLDALDGESFAGTIVRIEDAAQGAAQEGASVKYTARIALPDDDRMRIGMSAKAKIDVNKVEGALLVPIDAISEVGGESVVYTQVDESGELASPVTVATGLSDGDYVQVTDGLSEGDQVCYVPTVKDDDVVYY